MTFDLYRGACNSFNEPNPVVLLCFDSKIKECHMYVFTSHLILSYFSSFDGNLYQSAGSSSYSHYASGGMANYKGKAFITGCASPSNCFVKTELMDMDTLKWSAGPDYPFTSE